MFKIILKSLLKQGIKIKIIFIQMFVVFIAFNMGISMYYNSISFKININNFMEKDKTVKIIINVNSNNYNERQKIFTTIYEDIKNNKLVQKQGSYIQIGDSANNWIKGKENVNFKLTKVYINPSGLDLYDFNIKYGEKLDKKILSQYNDKIPILVGSNLENKLALNSVFTSKELINGKWIDADMKVVGIIKPNSIFWNKNQNRTNSLSNLNNSIVIPITGEYENIVDAFESTPYYGNNIVAKFNTKQDKDKFVKYIKNTYENNKCTIKLKTSNDLIEEQYNENITWIGIIFTFTLMLFVLSVIGLIGIVLSYLEKRSREFGIRYTMGSSVKKLQLLIFGEIIIIFVCSDILSLILYGLISKLFKSTILPSINIYPCTVSIFIAIILGLLTSLVPVINLSKISPVNLIKGEKR